ncbi:MAG: DUF115 domain-containing protein [Flavobacteriaceae bacterium]|nr:DUF115 domain-containing protein [Flavobacteriaceae bacterium]NVK83415.1 DUF115 domain-containing protein [Cytophagia bacterium]
MLNQRTNQVARSWIKSGRSFTLMRRVLFELRLQRALIMFDESFLIWRLQKKVGLKIRTHKRILLDLRNAYSDKKCLILGNGPSFEPDDLNYFEDHVKIGFNNAGLKEFANQIDIIIIEDPIVAHEMSKSRRLKDFNGLLLVAIHNSHLNFSRSAVYFKTDFPIDTPLSVKRSFSTDFSKISFLGGSVSYLGFQLAYYLGVREVSLIGFDHGYGKAFQLKHGDEYKRIKLDEEDHQLLSEQYGDSHNPYIQTGNPFNVLPLKFLEDSFEVANEYFLAKGVSIINRSRESSLSVFPRSGFDS